MGNKVKNMTKNKVKGWGSEGEGTNKANFVINVLVGTYASIQNI